MTTEKQCEKLDIEYGENVLRDIVIIIIHKSPLKQHIVRAIRATNHYMKHLDLTHIVQCRHNAVNFFSTNIHKRHPIARPSGRGMGAICGSSP